MGNLQKFAFLFGLFDALHLEKQIHLKSDALLGTEQSLTKTARLEKCWQPGKGLGDSFTFEYNAQINQITPIKLSALVYYLVW